MGILVVLLLMGAIMIGRMAGGIAIAVLTPANQPSPKAMAASITPTALQHEQPVQLRSIAANQDMVAILTGTMMAKPANETMVVADPGHITGILSW